MTLDADSMKIQSDFIYPATEALISKYSQQDLYLVRETAENYEKITKPLFLDKVDPNSMEWIYNVPDEKKEP